MTQKVKALTSNHDILALVSKAHMAEEKSDSDLSMYTIACRACMRACMCVCVRA